jgi:hypothetical protein
MAIRSRFGPAVGVFVSVLLHTIAAPSAVHGGIILGIVPDPPSTVGVAASTRSGYGAWHLFAIEDANENDLGIASYIVTLSGITAINNRSPFGSEVNGVGDAQPWGFANLRSATNTNPILASQPAPTADPTAPPLIFGFGRTANTASAAILGQDPAAVGISANTGASWGTYSDPFLYEQSYLATNGAPDAAAAIAAGRRWVFIAEGLGAASGVSVKVTAASFTVFID